MEAAPQDRPSSAGSVTSVTARLGLGMEFKRQYKITDKLGRGAFGSVWKAGHTSTGYLVAVKVIDRRKLKAKDDQAVFREVEVLKELKSHPHIVSLIDFFETSETFHVVLELASGGDLMRRITKRKRYTEQDARALAKNFLTAIEHIHSHSIVHRDLKPDNLLLGSEDDDTIGLKVADFGFAKKCPGKLRTRCGTPAYVAPEICVGVPYNEAVDVWSCGVILYLILSGKIPFHVKREPGKKHDLKALFLKIRAADYVFDEHHWDMISMSAKQVIARMLTVDPKRRITIKEALKSQWMTKSDEELGASAKVHLGTTIKNLRLFNARRSLKSAMIATTYATTAKFWTSDTVSFMSQNTTFAISSEFSTTSAASAASTKTLTSGKVGQHFTDLYNLQVKIRDGDSGTTVWNGEKVETSDQFAIKVLKRRSGVSMSEEDEKILNEVSILQSLRHYHVVKLHDFLEESSHFYMVMELMGGGDLFERIVTKEMYTEKDARELAKALLSAVDYIHSRGVAHRDLKPQNLLLKTRENDTYVKVGDFGFAKRVHTPKSLFTRCGTPTYVAPEILKGHPYDQAIDMWSVGVIIYVALVGYPPFLEQDQRIMLDKIRHGKYEFFEEDWSAISEQARGLIRRLLVVDPDNRWSASQALHHEWIAEIDDVKLSKHELRSSLASLTRRSIDFSGNSSAPFKSYTTLPS